MKTLPLCIGALVLTILVAGTLVLLRHAVPHVLQVYAIAEREDIGRNAQMDAIEGYVKKHQGEGNYKLHFASPRDVQASIQSLLTLLGGSSHLDAEAPLFIALDVPTSSSKKVLRAGIMDVDSLKGLQRGQALRAVVPVLTLEPQPKGTDPCAQLADDVIYAEENFGGIGFMLEESGLEVLKKCTQ